MQFILTVSLWITTIILTVLVVRAYAARKMPDLQPWHYINLQSEFKAADAKDGMTFQEYLNIEQQVFEELDNILQSTNAQPYCRYLPEGKNNPRTFTQDWNRTFELIPEHIQGGILLLHGLTDSPYSLRHIGQTFYEKGYYVLGLRLPAHGTIPAALKKVSYKDWEAATRIGMQRVVDMTTGKGPVLIAGYSNGGALAVKYALEALSNTELTRPDQLILISPAIGITRLAALANIHKLLSWIPYFEKSAWTEIYPEFDPFKYTSFPMSGASQTHKLTRSLQKEVDHAKKKGQLVNLPPVLTFISLADATVNIDDTINKLYNKLDPASDSELVIFDVNRMAHLQPFFKHSPGQHLNYLLDADDLPYTLTVISNTNDASTDLVEWKKPAATAAMTATDIELMWPKGVYSLTHVALPFPITDPVYGTKPDTTEDYGMHMGTMEPRGERGLLRIPASFFNRLRCNPFWPYMQQRIQQSTQVLKK